jgi:hypothetical protein
MNRLFPRMPIPENLALEFLGSFARCEYALKCSGFAKGNANSVEPDWYAFTKEVDWHFRRIKDEAFREAVQFLMTEPPRKQVLHDGRLQWKESSPDRNLRKAQQVLLMVRRIRNNLFHGAKVWSPEYSNRERDIKLLQAGLAVLKHCAQLNQRVHIAYEEGAF